MPDERNRSMVRDALQTSPECLDCDQLSEPMLNDAQREHVESCPRCQTERKLIRDFAAGGMEADERASIEWIASRLQKASPVPASPPGRPAGLMQRMPWLVWRPALALAGALVIAIGTGLYVQRGTEPEAPRLSEDAQPVYRSHSMELIAPSGDLDGPPGELRWQPVPQAVRYQVQLSEVDRTVLWHSEVPESRVELPFGVREKAVPGKTLMWKVTAYDAGGHPLASSTAERFRVRIRPTSR